MENALRQPANGTKDEMKIIKAIDKFYKLAFRKCKNCGKESVDLGPAGICNKCLGINFGFSPHDMSEHKRLEEALMPGRQWKLREIEKQKKRDLEMQNAPKEETPKPAFALPDMNAMTAQNKIDKVISEFADKRMPYVHVPTTSDFIMNLHSPFDVIPINFFVGAAGQGKEGVDVVVRSVYNVSEKLIEEILTKIENDGKDEINSYMFYFGIYPLASGESDPAGAIIFTIYAGGNVREFASCNVSNIEKLSSFAELSLLGIPRSFVEYAAYKWNSFGEFVSCVKRLI